jgi:hypothetical protein
VKSFAYGDFQVFADNNYNEAVRFSCGCVITVAQALLLDNDPRSAFDMATALRNAGVDISRYDALTRFTDVEDCMTFMREFGCLPALHNMFSASDGLLPGAGKILDMYCGRLRRGPDGLHPIYRSMAGLTFCDIPRFRRNQRGNKRLDELAKRVEKTFRKPTKTFIPDGFISSWCKNNACIAVIALCAVMKKCGQPRDVRWLVCRAVWHTRQSFEWSLGEWRFWDGY